MYSRNFFGFFIFFLIKGRRLSVCETNSFNIGGGNLSQKKKKKKSKYRNSIPKHCEFFLKKFAQPVKTARKRQLKKVTKQSLMRHNYFGISRL